MSGAEQIALTPDMQPTTGAPQVPAPRDPEPEAQARPLDVWRISGRPVDVHAPVLDDQEAER